MSAPSPTQHQHRYPTRSSPVTPAPTTPVRSESLFHLRADINVKETVCGRDSNGKRLAQCVFEGSSWDVLKVQIFAYCPPHVEYKATHEGEPRVWTIESENPTIADFDTFIMLKMGRYFFKPGNSNQAHRYLVEHQDHTFSVVVLKWGSLVSTSTDLQGLQEQCIRPQVQDRSGAAAESAHSQMVRELKGQWSTTYSSFESNWRMWEAYILKTPTHQHALHISNPPPATMLHLFEPVLNGAQVRNQNLQSSMAVALDVVDSSLEGLATLKWYIHDVASRIELDETALRAKRRAIEGFLQEVTPVAQRTDLIDLLRNIPNVNDNEHKEDDDE
ncbi:hypothetical protein H310_15104 [Aphanomyces invadans]|uniref:Uncharacterized protein n=1 Tax=Aphanomyces invadans TaxID=157072 RepID=A0A024T828_9STRA|nr:hypothetical protein H310_15104 [Aphanomyces invadans]ETV90064.1 hypothetical protein H310_15104 [Aphanomyces invadans]|eukprot:XP_008881303.1 hypothetical protein H310_15104 [Aphanomyces invadans]